MSKLIAGETRGQKIALVSIHIIGLRTDCSHLYRNESSIANVYSGNFMSSGLSAYMVLAMAAYGADGSSAQQMRETLHLPEDDSHACLGFQSYIDWLKDTKQVDLKIACKMYLADSFKIKNNFKKYTRKYFRSTCKIVDFKKSVKSAKVMHDWCVKKTSGKIKDIVHLDGLDTADMIMLSVAYFKAEFLCKFNSVLTEQKLFNIDKHTAIQVPMMYICDHFFYRELEEVNARVVALPYVNQDFHMVIVVPNKINGLVELEKNLEKVKLDFWSFTRNKKVMVLLPKFKVESTLNLNHHLMSGMSDVFTERANFKGICDENVRISQVIQKAFFEVYEERSEAIKLPCDRSCVRTVFSDSEGIKLKAIRTLPRLQSWPIEFYKLLEVVCIMFPDPRCKVIRRKVRTGGIILTCGQGYTAQLGLEEDVLKSHGFHEYPN
ncbi:antichymotrypsin-2-like [Copidosoma floridanum]|uniref:antichymotrypsin-2-like n=1 Tax=Copidosoma floridanum TaxID=29053 RepID=UPI000C6F96C2|nr:antichymotrypsin-2-like [Copidosoma floridanum]